MSTLTTDTAQATALGRVLGARLRHLRTDAGTSLDAVARRLGVSRHSIRCGRRRWVRRRAAFWRTASTSPAAGGRRR
ncbi:helix-turn-helix domain-containing protein [Streptomyces albidoflavus]|uniref:helix-turn-helix domain-containing protein n=1 Tax=Streptomyces albidoflavus TaxID=1886 RepID=UPI0015964286|nr:helix-turn-helix domain-containing protein [Streptomyces albidoflavus]